MTAACCLTKFRKQNAYKQWKKHFENIELNYLLSYLFIDVSTNAQLKYHKSCHRTNQILKNGRAENVYSMIRTKRNTKIGTTIFQNLMCFVTFWC